MNKRTMCELYTNGNPWWWRGCPNKNRAPGNKAKEPGGGEGYDCICLKFRGGWGLRKVEAERWSHVKQFPTPLSSQRRASIIHECWGLPFFLSSHISRLYLFRPIPNPFLSYLHQRYLSWLHLDGSSLAGLHPKWKSFTAPSWASTSGQRTSTNPQHIPV